jgi:hypothetical protein
MTDQRTNPESSRRQPVYEVRFEATVYPGPKLRRTNWMDQLQRLDIDRIQDPKGQVRVLVTADDCVRLLEHGFEVRLQHAHPVRPLDRALIEGDESLRRWVEDQLRGIPRATGSEGTSGPGGR